ncbi:MAG: hypothetical protein QXP58_01800 [Thermoprotei archaeon]
MLTPYEIAVKSVIPALRRMVAEKLIKEHSFTQQRAAAVLGISQSAISRYDTRNRGVAIDLESHDDVVELVEELSKEIALSKLAPIRVAKRIDEICDYVLRHGYMCDFHARIDPSISKQKCGVCLDDDSAVA